MHAAPPGAHPAAKVVQLPHAICTLHQAGAHDEVMVPIAVTGPTLQYAAALPRPLDFGPFQAICAVRKANRHFLWSVLQAPEELRQAPRPLSLVMMQSS